MGGVGGRILSIEASWVKAQQSQSPAYREDLHQPLIQTSCKQPSLQGSRERMRFSQNFLNTDWTPAMCQVLCQVLKTQR